MANICPFLLKIWKFLKIHCAILGQIYYFPSAQWGRFIFNLKNNHPCIFLSWEVPPYDFYTHICFSVVTHNDDICVIWILDCGDMLNNFCADLNLYNFSNILTFIKCQSWPLQNCLINMKNCFAKCWETCFFTEKLPTT